MGLIINNKIPQLKKGYPTVSDKYNVTGGILEGTDTAEFGQLVKIADDKGGYFTAVNGDNTLTAASEIGGIILATNVKMPYTWPANVVGVQPGEAFNLFMNGFIAVEVDDDDDIVANAPVYVTSAGVFTATSTSNIAFPGVFTGTVEEDSEGRVLAEIYVPAGN